MQRPKQNNKKIIIGITGSFGSGKTTVSSIFKAYGAGVVDADKIAHQIIKRGSKVYKKIIKTFGPWVLKKDKAIDRKKLGGIVFNNKSLLKKLNALVHPQVIRHIKKEVKSLNNRIVVLDIPLLVEAGLGKIVDKLVVVRAAKNKQIKRAKSKTSLSRKEILKRINSQISLSEKVRLADFVIDNSGTLKNTKKQIKAVWRSLVRLRRTRD